MNSANPEGGGGLGFLKAFHLSEHFLKDRKQSFHILYLYIRCLDRNPAQTHSQLLYNTNFGSRDHGMHGETRVNL